jgi:hypothetical protein
MNLSITQQHALRGELTPEDWCSLGVGFFKMGLVSLDPLRSENDPMKFTLTPAGVEQAKALRERPDG